MRHLIVGTAKAVLAPATSPSRVEVVGNFQLRVLRCLRALGRTEAFPAEIARRLSEEEGRHVSLAQVFTALERLEGRGLVSSADQDPQPVRGGRRRRIFQLEEPGARALASSAAATADRASSGEREAPNGTEPAIA